MSDPDFTSSPPIGMLVIHGVGLIGGSLGMAARQRGLAREIVGVGRDPSRLDAAVRLGAIGRFALAESAGDLAAACIGADLVILCTPVSNIVADLPSVLEALGPHGSVTDVGSVKQAIVDAAGGDGRFVGSHPMTGSELAGINAARADLFDDAMWAITPTRATSHETLATVRRFAQGVGARTRILSAEMHDQAVAVTSHLPHLLAYALTAMAAEDSTRNADLPYLTAGSFAGATRVAASRPSLWMDICRANRSPLSCALRNYRALLDSAQQAIDRGEWDKLEELFQDGWDAKQNWPER